MPLIQCLALIICHLFSSDLVRISLISNLMRVFETQKPLLYFDAIARAIGSIEITVSQALSIA